LSFRPRSVEIKQTFDKGKKKIAVEIVSGDGEELIRRKKRVSVQNNNGEI